MRRFVVVLALLSACTSSQQRKTALGVGGGLIVTALVQVALIAGGNVGVDASTAP